MRSRDFDFETAIWDCRSAAVTKSLHMQVDVPAIESLMGRLVLASTRDAQEESIGEP
jgi:predicted N-formylglutamate amidohydrolase